MERSCRPGRFSCIRSTSNHNRGPIYHERGRLFPVSVLHQTTTSVRASADCRTLFPISVLHQTTTITLDNLGQFVLFPISVLHQTTTQMNNERETQMLFPISVLHQTTTSNGERYLLLSCFPYPSTSNHNNRIHNTIDK